MPDSNEDRAEREQTDESLRVERQKVDWFLGDEQDAIDGAADAVINRARARADEVLAAARASMDKKIATTAPGPQLNTTIKTERALEDHVLREERADADETLRTERAERSGPLSFEREVTDKHLSRERAQSDHALATRDEVLAIVSHNLQNILNSVVGFAELIAEEASRDQRLERIFKHAQHIQRSGARMDRLIGDLLDMVSIEAGGLAVTREVSEPAHVVTEAVDSFQAQASASGVSLVAEIVPPTSLAVFDPARILQVLVNLISNAIKFTPRGGKVVVRVESIEAETRISVIDTGVGIPPDKLEAIFERFYQIARNDRRGKGLGLYISKCIVRAHDGRLWAESKLGEGSTFIFTIPRWFSSTSAP